MQHSHTAEVGIHLFGQANTRLLFLEANYLLLLQRTDGTAGSGHLNVTLSAIFSFFPHPKLLPVARARAKPDGTRAETTFRLSPKRTSPFKSAGESVQSTAGSRGGRISVNAEYTTFRGRVRVLATHSIRLFPLHFPSRASPCATTFRTQYTSSCQPLCNLWVSEMSLDCVLHLVL